MMRTTKIDILTINHVQVQLSEITNDVASLNMSEVIKLYICP